MVEPDDEGGHEVTITPETSSLPGIQSVYEQMGLATAADRSRFTDPPTPRTPPDVDVVISTTSEPFRG